MNEENLQVYLDFVRERHRVWERRQSGSHAPWTDDPVLRDRKFCNMFRVLDFGSQFLIRELLAGEDRSQVTTGDMLMRCFLYRYTNRPEPWEFFRVIHGRYPVRRDLNDGTLMDCWQTYRDGGGTVFGIAFKIFVGRENAGIDRLTWIVNLTREYFGLEGDKVVVPALASVTTLEERLAVLQTIPRCRDFMSMQVATDIGYSASARGDEDEMVLAGPGAVKGASLIHPGRDAVDVIRWLQEEYWHTLADAPALRLSDGRLRPLSLMDVQNTLCEFGKYMRYRSGGPARSYRLAHPGPMPAPVLPDHWSAPTLSVNPRRSTQ